MNLEIRSQPLSRTLYGLAGAVRDRCYGEVGTRLMDALWKDVEAEGLPHKGINHWIYDDEDSLFVGVELEAAPGAETALECKEVELPRYAYWKHVGSYAKLADVHAAMHQELRDRGISACRPSLEIYGHWNDDETRLETEVLIGVE